jgi:ABC-2 type transport system ATP-binding protein
VEIFITHLTKDYGKFRALEDISLYIPKGMYGLLGPNGAGKTTLLRILTTLLPPTSGQVQVGGFDVRKDPGVVRQRLGYLPQDFGFYRSLTAFETLDYIATMKNIPRNKRKEQVLAVLAEVHLLDKARQKVGTFSGGMRQRLGIAQALLGEPELLVVDEPTAGLDPEERLRFRNLLACLAQERTVLLSTHIVADIQASCSGVAVLDCGRLVFHGSPAELVAKARGRVWEIELDADEWRRIVGHYPVHSSRVVNGGMQVRLLAEDAPMGRARPVEPTLEDGYMAAMKDMRQKEGPNG